MSLNRKTTKMFLVVVMMLAMVFPTSVFAASGDVTSIEFDTNESKIYLTVNETSEQLRVLANIEGSSTKKDVTNESTWTSSNTRIVKVDGGLIIPLEKGTAELRQNTRARSRRLTSTLNLPLTSLNWISPIKWSISLERKV